MIRYISSSVGLKICIYVKVMQCQVQGQVKSLTLKQSNTDKYCSLSLIQQENVLFHNTHLTTNMAMFSIICKQCHK